MAELLPTFITTRTYKYNDIYVDIVENPIDDVFEAWIYDEHHGTKSYIYGMPADGGSMSNYLDFLESIKKNIDEYIEDYFNKIIQED